MFSLINVSLCMYTIRFLRNESNILIWVIIVANRFTYIYKLDTVHYVVCTNHFPSIISFNAQNSTHV